MTIIAGLLYTVFGRLLGRYKGALAAALGIALYTLLVGAGASVVRAALMSELASWFLKEREWQLLAGKLFG